MKLTGDNFIGRKRSSSGNFNFYAINPEDGNQLPVAFTEATSEEVDEAVQLASKAFLSYNKMSGSQKSAFLRAIGEEILALDNLLVERCCQETGLPEGRIIGERGRTIGQMNMFADLLNEGSWVDARIETAIPDRSPIPKPDIRSMLRPLGPVGVFGASNFPLAFSVAGGDTASALAAGCPVVVKGHPSHPGTSELIAGAIVKAAERTGMPEGVFSMVQGPSIAVGMAIVTHPDIKAIGFTGSYRGGKAIFDAAASRSEPIPVFAEMGSTNPVFILPGAMRERREEIAKGLTTSVTLGSGQFCTNPGLVFTEDEEFSAVTKEYFARESAAIMLNQGILSAYNKGVDSLSDKGVKVLAAGVSDTDGFRATPTLFSTGIDTFLENAGLEEENFGPSTVLLTGKNKQDILLAAKKLSGHLTATLHGTPEDLQEYAELIGILEQKVGRLIINGFPTGVEVCHAMVHGGPFPATTDSRSTSVGSNAITRFTRPVCYQNFPDHLLSDELKTENPLGIWRIIDGERKK